jgi:hypothetical protein
VLQARIFLEMQTNSQVMQVVAQLKLVLVALEAFRLTDGEEIPHSDMVALVPLQGLAHPPPGRRQGRSDVGQSLQLLTNGADEVVEALVRGKVRPVGGLQAREAGAQAGQVDVAPAVLLLVLDDQQRATAAQKFHHVQPPIEVGIFFAVVHH